LGHRDRSARVGEEGNFWTLFFMELESQRGAGLVELPADPLGGGSAESSGDEAAVEAEPRDGDGVVPEAGVVDPPQLPKILPPEPREFRGTVGERGATLEHHLSLFRNFRNPTRGRSLVELVGLLPVADDDVDSLGDGIQGKPRLPDPSLHLLPLRIHVLAFWVVWIPVVPWRGEGMLAE